MRFPLCCFQVRTEQWGWWGGLVSGLEEYWICKLEVWTLKKSFQDRCYLLTCKKQTQYLSTSQVFWQANENELEGTDTGAPELRLCVLVCIALSVVRHWQWLSEPECIGYCTCWQQGVATASEATGLDMHMSNSLLCFQVAWQTCKIKNYLLQAYLFIVKNLKINIYQYLPLLLNGSKLNVPYC